MKVMSAPFLNERTYSTLVGTKTRVTISQYDEAWVWESDTDITDRVLKGQPLINSEIEDDIGEFQKDNLNLDLEDQDKTVRDLIYTIDKYFLINVEKGFNGIADWVILFDGIINAHETIEQARNIASIVAYSMEEELEMQPATNSASSGGANIALATAVGDLWDLSYINIPGGNRIISVPPQIIPLCDYTGMDAREALNGLAELYGCIWKRTERDTAMFVSRKYIGGTFNLDTDLYQPNFDYSTRKSSDGIHTENTAAAVEGFSAGYVDGYNEDISSQLLTIGCRQCHWCAEENYSFRAYNRRIFQISALYLLELEPLDRVNLSLRDKDGSLEETLFTQYMGSEYDDNNKITTSILEERMPRIYERAICGDTGGDTIYGARWMAQTYTIGAESYNQIHDIVRSRLRMYRVNNPGNLTVGIRATVAGQPFGVDLCNVTVNANTFTVNVLGLWYSFLFTTTAAQALGTQYAIVSRAPAAVGPANQVVWRRLDITHPSSPPNYTGGTEWYSLDSGFTWNQVSDDDFMFECWGDQ